MSVLDPLLSVVTGNPAAAFFLGILLLGFLVGIWRYLRPLRRRASAFKDAARRVSRYSGRQFPEDPFPDGHGWLNEMWNEYMSSYREAQVDVRGKPVSPTAPEETFTRSRVLRGYNRNQALVLAGVFLGLGILGTFTGLVLGLHDVDTSSSDRLLTSVNSLLSGMSTAFWSSIGGIFFSTVWLIFDRAYFNRLRSSVQQFLDEVRRTWPSTSSDEAVLEMLALQADQKAILQELGTDLAQAFQDAIDKSFSQELSPSLDSIDETLERVSSQVEDRQAEVLDEMATSFQERLLDSVEEQFDELATAIEGATRWQQRVTEDVGSLFSQISELSETNTRLLENSSEAADRFLSSLDRLSESQERMAEITSNLEEVTQRTASLSEEFRSQSEVFADANEELRSELAQQLDLVETQVESLTEFWNEMHADLDTLSESLSENLTEFTQITEEKLGQVFHRFDSEMSTVVEHLGGTLAELREVTEELEPAMQRIESALDETLEPITDSREQIAELTGSIRALDGLPDHLSSASNRMEEARQALVRLDGRIETLNGQLGDGGPKPRTGAEDNDVEQGEPLREGEERRADEGDEEDSSFLGFGGS